jgi:hypothetical protein
MASFYENKLIEPNLIISHKAFISNSKCEEVYKKIYEYILNNSNSIISEEATLYELIILKKREPNYIFVKYINNKGWLYSAIPIESHTEIIFTQLEFKVEITVNMYKIIEHQTIRLFDFNVLTYEKARLTWVDFILEIFKVANIDNFKDKIKELLPDDIQKHRNKIEESYKHNTINNFKKLIVWVLVFMVILYVIGLIRNLYIKLNVILYFDHMKYYLITCTAA